jgi:predicted permease
MEMSGLFYDLRFSIRGLLRDRAFTVTAIAMLALALGLNVTVFTIMQANLFRGIPLVERNDRIVYIQTRRPTGGWNTQYADFDAWRTQARSFEDVAFNAGSSGTFRADGRLTDMLIPRITANTFRMLGLHSIMGRDFASTDEAAGAPPVVIISYEFWERRFARRADIIGRTVRVNDLPATIVGVMPKGFVIGYEQHLWMPLARTAELQGPGFAGGSLALLRPGVTRQQAQTELAVINRRLDAADPSIDRSTAPSVMNFSEAYLGPDARLLYGSLWAGAWFVLLIACANLANLTLVRTIGRWREFSTRIALGAGQSRLIRQIFAASLLLAAAAGTLGWWLTKWTMPKWAATASSRYLVLDFSADSGTLAYMIAITLFAAVFCSLVPVVRIAQLGQSGRLTIDSRGVTQNRRDKRLAASLVAGQMVLALVLLSGAGVLVRSLLNIVEANTGVRQPENVLSGSMRVPSNKYQTPATRLAYFDRLEARLRDTPGVESESIASTIPVNSGNIRTFEIEGRPNPITNAAANAPTTDILAVGPNYFELVGSPAMSGRPFNDTDQLSSLPVAIVNQSFANRYWPGAQALGKRLRIYDLSKLPGDWLTVVGVVPNIMQGDALRRNFRPLIYQPFRQTPTARGRDTTGTGFNGAYFLLRTVLPPARVAQTIRSAAQEVDSDVTLEEFQTLAASFGFSRDRMDLKHAELNKHAAMAPVFAAVALVLAAIGLYAVIAHSIGQRTKEIGVRMAIGAARDIGRMVLREGMATVIAGVILGAATSLAVNRLLQSQLVGVTPYDPISMGGAPAVLIGIALAACRIPARRAMKISPALALRKRPVKDALTD